MNTPRKDFEAWAGPRGFTLSRFEHAPDEYIIASTRDAWLSWQAAQAAMPAAEPTGWISVDERLPESWLDAPIDAEIARTGSAA